MQGKTDSAYIAIDLKSFYASVECVDRGLDPLTTNLVVADQSRSDKTIQPCRCRPEPQRQNDLPCCVACAQILRYFRPATAV